MENLGSIKEKRVAKALLEERAQCNFDRKEMESILNTNQEFVNKYQDWVDIISSHKETANSHKYYDMTREEQIKFHFQRINKLY